MTLLVLVSFMALSSGFQWNVWRASDSRWFAAFPGGPEGLVIGRLCKSRSDGLLSAGGLPGSTGAGLNRQYADYMQRIQTKEFVPYCSQSGLQANLFALLDSVSPATPSSNIELFHAVTAAVSAAALSLVILWFYLEFGIASAGTVLITTLYSQWLTVFGRSMWWFLGAFYLPLICTSFGLLFETRCAWPMRRYESRLVCLAVLTKCLLNGFEFVLTTVVMLLVPYVYYSMRFGWTSEALRSRLANVVMGTICGGSLAICALSLQIASVHGSFSDGAYNVWDCLYRRTIGRQTVFGPGGTAIPTPGSFETLARYFKGVAIDLNAVVGVESGNFPRPTLRVEFRQLMFLFLGATAIAIRSARVAGRSIADQRKLLGLIASTWFALLAPLAWFVVFMGHATVHFHLDHVVWHMPFTLYGFALCGATFGVATTAEQGRPRAAPVTL